MLYCIMALAVVFYVLYRIMTGAEIPKHLDKIESLLLDVRELLKSQTYTKLQTPKKTLESDKQEAKQASPTNTGDPIASIDAGVDDLPN